MENKSHALLAGLFTIALLTATILIGLWLNRDRIEWVPYQLATKLSIPGLNPQATVRYRGFDVGKVDDITFDPQVSGQILVHISIQPNTPITRSTYGTLGYQGVTGIAYVQLDDDGRNPIRVPSTRQHVARIEMRPSLLDNLQNRGLAILIQTEELAKRLNALLQPDNQQAMLAAFNNVSKAAAAIETIPKQLQPTLAKLPAVTAQSQQTLAALATLSKDASTLSHNLNTLTTALQTPEGPIAKISSAAEQVSTMANKVELDALPLTQEVRSILRALNRTIDHLNEHPQSILFGPPRIVPGPGEPGFTESPK